MTTTEHKKKHEEPEKPATQAEPHKEATVPVAPAAHRSVLERHREAAPKEAPAAAAPGKAPEPAVRPLPPESVRSLRPGEATTKASHGVTKTVEEHQAHQQLKSAVDELARPGVIKVPDFDVPKKPGEPVAAAATSEVVTVGPAPPGKAVAPPVAGAAPTKRPMGMPEPKKDIKLPDWFKPDPNDPYPLGADDVYIDLYPILEPHAYVLVTYNLQEKDIMYRAIEPRLTGEEEKILKFVESTMVDLLHVDPEELDRQGHQAYLAKKFDEVLYDYAIVLGDDEKQEQIVKAKLLYYLNRDFIGENRIDIMSRDELIEDISCDGAHQPIFLYHRKYESIKSNVKFANDDELDSFVIRMAQRAGKHVSIAEPILDATMRDGSRLQATLAREVSAHGSTFTIRKFRSEPFTPPDLVRFGTMSAEILAYWWIAIQNAASAIYAGGTASGKTTGLNAILLFIPPQMKIVSIEDTRELSLPHPNWIAGITRAGFGARDKEGRQVGEIDMFQLLKNALRQRPEYIIVGEVRGKEAYNLFQAMATGHAAYGTMHADSVDAVIHRLESDPINIPRSLLEALDIVSIQIQTRVGGKRVRRTHQLSEIVGVDPHTREILTNEVFRWQPKDDSFRFSGVSYVLERIQVEKGMTAQQMKSEIDNRVEIIKYMIKHGVRNYKDVARIVTSYYKDPVNTMEKVHKDESWH